jgi:DNA-binding GntR family transcriptional regulator
MKDAGQDKCLTDGGPGGRPLHGESVYDRLRKDIHTGQLRPGARLTETELASRLSVSRTPVREAIRRLESEGLVDHVPRFGAVVRQLDHSEIMELYEMRAVLEGTAARLAARAASAVELDELGAINADMAQATGNVMQLAQLNRQFHLLMLNAARNRFLLRAMQAADSAMMILGPSSMELPERARDAVAEHAAVLAALAARDDVQAEKMMRAHMEGAQRARLRMLRESRTSDSADD